MSKGKVSSQLASSSPSDDKLSKADVQGYLKDAGMPSTGEKGTLWWRCKLHHKVSSMGLVTDDGVDPTELRGAKLRKAAARAGVSPIGTPDEMLEGLVDHLAKEQQRGGGGGDATTTTAQDASSSSDTNNTIPASAAASSGPALAGVVLSLSEDGIALAFPVRVLQLSDPTLSPTSPASDLRRAYLKISLKIHPDRIGRVFPDATKAFQVLVTAFETLTSPDFVPSDDTGKGKGKGKKKTARISRSNEGCFRTGVYCPRCSSRWGDKVEGNPEYYYNVMMQGLKSFHCATCLLKFGCMSAKHQCPKCRAPFSYSPADYHRQITCTKTSCKTPFGFHLYHMSDLSLKYLREEIIQTRDDHAKKVSGMKRRAARGSRATPANNEELLGAFAAGLADECPRCGMTFDEIRDGGSTEEGHLLACDVSDEVAGRRQKKKRDAEREKEAKKEEVTAMQDDAEANAAWEFLGSNNDQLYLLSADQLSKQLKEKGLKVGKGGDKADMIAELVNQERSLVVASGSGKNKKGGGRASSLPSLGTLQRMRVDELRAVLASHGVGGGKLRGMSKKKMLGLLEDKVYGGDNDAKEEVKLIGNGGDHGKKKAKKRKTESVVDSSDADDSSDGDESDDCDEGWEPQESKKRRTESTDEVLASDDDDLDDCDEEPEPDESKKRRPESADDSSDAVDTSDGDDSDSCDKGWEPDE